MPKREQDTHQDMLLPANLTRHIETLEEELRIEHDRYLRTLADLTNYRRRTEREGNKYADQGKREILLPLLGVVDDMEKALHWAGTADKPLVEGIRHIHQKLLGILDAHGVHSFDSVHTMFDHDLHDAVAVAGDTGYPAGTVVDELSRGYHWHSGVLRAAQVRVAA